MQRITRVPLLVVHLRILNDRRRATGAREDAETLGRALADELIESGASRLIDAARAD